MDRVTTSVPRVALLRTVRHLLFLLKMEHLRLDRDDPSEKKHPSELRVINRRKFLTLEKKLEIIKAHESGKTYAKIARENGMNESSIRSILRKKVQYREQASHLASFMSKVVVRQRNSSLNIMERHLIAWIEECNQKRIQLTENAIQSKALALFNELKEQGDGNKKFTASRGWFYRFKSRVNLQNCVISGDKPASDAEAAERFVPEVRKIIEEGGYTHRQIFNVDETMLYWKKIPSETFLAETEKSNQGYRPSKDCLTVLVGSNASGDLRLKPLVVFRAHTPSALRDCEKTSLPVIWHSSKKAWLTQEIFTHWFSTYFCPTVEAYCEEKGIEFKILLLLDTAPTHDIQFSNEHVKVVWFPPNTASLLQPMSQGVFTSFKCHYLRHILSQAMQASTADEPQSLVEFWKNYNIKIGTHNISASWDEFSTEDLASVWHQILPNVPTNNLEAHIESVAQDIISMGKYFGLQNLELPNVENQMDTTTNFMEDQKVETEQQVFIKEEVPDVEEWEEVEEPEEIGMEDLEKILLGVDSACEAIMAGDTDVERSIKVRQALQNGIQCYRDLYLERKKSYGIW